MYTLIEQFGISSPYGKRPGLMGNFHFGTDMPCPIGTDIPCVKEGTVFMAGWISFTVDGRNYQELVCIVNRPDGRFTNYDHLSQVFVKKGDKVSKGQIIAKSGNSGYVTGPHLHLQQGIGQYTGGLFANYKTEDPEPELRAWTLQGAADDMNPTEIARGIRRVTNPTNQVPDSVIAADAGRIMAEGKIDGVLIDNLSSVPWRTPEQFNVTSLEIYDAARGGTNPHQFAVDRVLGGQDFAGVMNSDMPSYKTNEAQVASLVKKIQDATIDAFRQAYLTRAGEYPTKDQIADWQHSDSDMATWVNAHAVNTTETELQRQLDIQTRAVGSLQTTTQQALKARDDTISRLEAQLAGKTPLPPAESTPAGEGEIIFSPQPEPDAKPGSFLRWLVDILKLIAGGRK